MSASNSICEDMLSAPFDDDNDLTEQETDDEDVAPMTLDFNKQVRPYIDLIDKLRSEGLDQDINLPAVAVIGDQSSGKSSTLEAISGIQLPRGSGIVTRCPLELRLKSTVKKDGFTWWGRISYKDKENQAQEHEILDPNEVGELVENAQEEMTDDKKGISEGLITLDIESKDVPDLTLIDLPGITRVAVEGQDSNVPEKIRKLIEKRIKKQETIMLAVIPANVDLATIEALQMAQQIDPAGDRTLGVVTKPDLVDRGAESELIATVTNQRVVLTKGYTVVKCRNQQMIKEGQSLQKALNAEEEYFKNAEHFQNIDANLMGIKNLSRKLTTELVEQIKITMPKLRKEVIEKKEITQKDLARLGQGVPDSREEKTIYLLELLRNYTDQVKSVCENDNTSESSNEYRLITQIRKAFEDLVRAIARKIPSIGNGVYGGFGNREFIEKIIKENENARGAELPRFMNFRVCKKIIIDIINQYSEDCRRCLKEVDKLVNKILTSLVEDHFKQFPILSGEIMLLIMKKREAAGQQCLERIEDILEMEKLVFAQDRIFNHDLDVVKYSANKTHEVVGQGHYQHHNKNKAGQDMSSIAENLASGHRMTNPHVEADREVKKKEAEDMYDMILAYLEVSMRRLVDYVPLTIQLHLIKRLSETISKDLVKLAVDPKMVDLIYEDGRTVSRRETLKKKVKRLQIAEEELIKFQ